MLLPIVACLALGTLVALVIPGKAFKVQRLPVAAVKTNLYPDMATLKSNVARHKLAATNQAERDVWECVERELGVTASTNPPTHEPR